MADLQQPNAQHVSRAIQYTADGYQDLATEAARIQNIPAFNQGGQIIQIACTGVARATAASKPVRRTSKPVRRTSRCVGY